MRLPQTYCCRWSLQTGGLLVGWYEFIYHILIIPAITITMEDRRLLQIYKINNGLSQSNIFGILLYMVVASVIYVVVSIPFLVGIYLKKHQLLLPWLTVEMIFNIGSALCVFIVGLKCFIGGFVGEGIIVYFFGSAVIGSKLYLWLCMISLYKAYQQNVKNPHVV